MNLVVIESPYAGDIERNVSYARMCVRDSLFRGESPQASHIFFTQEGILRDEEPEERALGIEAGLAWGKKADLTAVYVDHGISKGMEQGIARAHQEGRPVEERSIFAPPFCYLDRYGVIRIGLRASIDASIFNVATNVLSPPHHGKPWDPMLALPFLRRDNDQPATDREKIIEWCWVWGSNTPDEPLDYNPQRNPFRKQRLYEAVTKGKLYFRKFCKLYLSEETMKRIEPESATRGELTQDVHP